MKKRIAFISEHASPLATLGGVDSGGQNVYVDKLTKQLANLGYDIDIYTRWDDKRLPQIVDCHNGVRVIHVKAGPIEVLKKEALFPYMDEFTDNMMICMKEQNAYPELIHANFWMSGYVALTIKKALSIPFVITFHALGKVRRQFQGKADGFPDSRFEIEERIVKEADHIIAECPQDKEDLLVHYAAHQDKISIIPCGFDQHEFYPIDKRLARMTIGINPDENVILQLGRMVPRKGVDTVIQALGHLRTISDIKVRLLIVGGESDTPDAKLTPEIGRLRTLAEHENVAEFVTFTGRRNRDQLKYFYNAADVFVSVPWYEPFGITPLEAMACGTPVIGANVGGIKFSVVDKVTGFLVPPSDPQTLGEKLRDYFADTNLQSQFEQHAIQRVNTFFTWETIAQNVSLLYQKIFTDSNEEILTDERQLAIIDDNIESLIDALQHSQQTLASSLIDAANIISTTLAANGKILVCGNGGSATDAQHMAVELVGRYMISERIGLPVMSLTSDMSILTAWSNDFSFETVFARQVEAYGQEGDVLLGISTSGNSKNVLEALKTAREKNMICIGLIGKDGGEMKNLCDVAIIVPSENTQRIQEIHTHLIHSLCELIERQLFPQLMKPKDDEQNIVGMKYGKTTMKPMLVDKHQKKGGHK